MNLATPRWAYKLGEPIVTEDGSRYVNYLKMWWWYRPIFALQVLIVQPSLWRIKRQVKREAAHGRN